jgi:geranylgeranyl pyrophosphate synthase
MHDSESPLVLGLTQILTKHSLSNRFLDQAKKWALFPAGKLLRPRMMESLAKDINSDFQPSDRFLKLQAFIEFHHTYTLVHDDLPCMDDDDYRRGRLSVHKKFSENTAVLTGDSLLLTSMSLLMQAELSRASDVAKFVDWSLGDRGLIGGQVQDLSGRLEGVEEIVRMFELKTSRLFQVALCLTAHFVRPGDKDLLKDCFRLGSYWGILFQCLDDQSELIEEASFDKEKDKNIFVIDDDKAKEYVQKYEKRVDQLLKKRGWNKLRDDFGKILEHFQNIGPSL